VEKICTFLECQRRFNKNIFNSCFFAYTLPVVGNLFSFFDPVGKKFNYFSFSGVLLICERGLLLSNLLYDPEQAGHVQLVACSPLLTHKA
jgi:hypothetical protein